MNGSRRTWRWFFAMTAFALTLSGTAVWASGAHGNTASAASTDIPVSYSTLSAVQPRPSLGPSLPAQVLSHIGRAGGATTPRGGTALVASPLTTANAPTLAVGTTLDGLRNPNATPPDTQVAVGPTEIIEMVNNSASVWSKSGSLISTLDLNSLFGIPELVGSDPRVIYDASSGRFFATYISYNPPPYNLFFGNDTTVQVLWSLGSAPTGYGDWNGCTYVDTTGRLHDNPALGVSDDKVAIGTDVFAWPQAAQDPSLAPLGADTLLIDKSTALSNTTPCPAAYLPPVNAGIIRPAQSLSPTAPLYMASLPESGGTTATLWTVTGSVNAQTIGRTRVDLPMAGTTMPPAAIQQGSSNDIQTNDTRALEAVWADGLLDVTANTGCVPAGDSVTRACLHLLQINTASPAVTHEATISGPPGSYLYYPALRPDGASNAVLVYTSSSATGYPSVGAAALDPTWSAMTSTVVKQGVASYTGFDTAPYRWGDYSGAAVDPSDGSIWVAGEYSASSTTGDWGTFIAQLQTGSPPPVTATPTPIATNTSTPTGTPPPSLTPTATATTAVTATPTSSPTPTASSTSVPTVCPRGKAKHGRC